MSLVTDEVCGGEVLPCTTHCPNRGTRKGNERGKRHLEKSVGIGGKVGKRDMVTAVFGKIFFVWETAGRLKQSERNHQE